MKVAFIGLGIMGQSMARNLLKNNVSLTVYNRSHAPADALEAEGATKAHSPSEAVKGADIVFSMLSTPQVVSEVFFGEGNALVAMEPNAIWVDCTTVDPAFSRQAHIRAKAASVRFLGAPVAGTKPHAANAHLTFFVGGEAEPLAEVQPLLEFMGQKVLHLGSDGMGASFKMLVNGMLAQSMLVFSEAILLGEKMGLDKAFLLNTLPNLVVAAPFTKAKAEMIREDDYEVQFPLEWMHKDLHLLTLTGYEQNQPLFMANLAKEVFAAAKESGLSRADFAAVHKYLEAKK